jgi:hypothetical protein
VEGGGRLSLHHMQLITLKRAADLAAQLNAAQKTKRKPPEETHAFRIGSVPLRIRICQQYRAGLIRSKKKASFFFLFSLRSGTGSRRLIQEKTKKRTKKLELEN